MSNTNQILNELNATVGGFTASVDVKVSKVNEITDQIRKNADTTFQEINNFKQSMIENEQMQSAQENILRLNQIIRERFSDYDSIRKTVMGVVKDFDIDLVRNKTITELSEELWMTSSRYWLSYTLIAISAWASDNKGVAKNAVSESYRADKIKTSLFFCLMNLRFNRVDVAREWLCEYFNSIIPEDIKDETAILLQSYINGLFGIDKEIEYVVKDVVDSWIEAINIVDENNEKLSAMFLEYIQNIPPKIDFKSEYLKQYCKAYPNMGFPYGEAKKYDVLIKKIKSLDVENIIQNAADYKARVDAVLRDLITNYDAEELELKQQQEYYNLVIENKGKEEIAEQQFNAILEKRSSKQNIGEKCVEWALYSKSDSINIHVQKFGFQNTKNWFLSAINTWSNEFEKEFPDEYPIQVEEWECVSNGDDLEEQEISLRAYLEKNKFKIKYVNKPNIISLILFVILLTVSIFVKVKFDAPTPVFLGILGGSLLFLLILAIRIFTASSRFNKKVKYLLSLLTGTMSELTEYRKTYAENKDKKAELFALIEQL